MALIKCVECGKEISTSAKRCPYCGCPAKKSVQADRQQQAQIVWENYSPQEKERASVISVVAIIVFIILAGFLLKSCFSAGPSKNHNDGKCDICGKPATHSGSGYEYCDKDFKDATEWIMNR